MYTQEEAQQLKLLSDRFKTLTETTVKQVDGGYMITHTTTYIDGDEIIQAQTKEIAVTSHKGGILHHLSGIYGGLSEPKPWADKEPTLPESEYYPDKVV